MAIILESLHLTAFKGFREFSVPLAPFTCLVGLNSKGKTSVLQAIRLLHDMFVFAFGAKDQPEFSSPRWQANPSQSLAKFSFDDPSAVWLHRKTTEPCKIGLTASGGLAILLEIKGPSQYNLDVQLHGQSVRPSIADSAIQQLLSDFFLLNPILVPPVGPVSPSEQLLPFPEMQQRSEQGRPSECWRSYLHWLYNDGMRREFDNVIALIQRYLPETVLLPPRLTHDSPPKVLVQFEEEDTTLDISHSGSGMRTLLNLAVVLKFAQTGCLLFDEPDSHLHGSLQRAVARMLLDFAAENGVQVIIATHAPDFVSEMPVDALVWIDRNRQEAHRANKLGQVLADLGNATSADAVRAYGADKVLFVEGTLDRQTLEQLLGPFCTPNPFTDPTVLLASLPNGKGDARHLNLFSALLRDTFRLNVRMAAVVDNDFDFTQVSAGAVAHSAEPMTVSLPRKEIENFFIEPAVFARALVAAADERRQFTGHDVAVPDEAEVRLQLDQLLNSPEYRDSVKWQIVPRYEDSLDSRLDVPTRRQRGEEWFEQKWNDAMWRIRNCPGKKVLAALRKWAQATYSLTVSNAKLCNACREVANDLNGTATVIIRHLYGTTVEGGA